MRKQKIFTLHKRNVAIKAHNGYRLGEDWALEFQLLGLARLAKLVPGQITADDSYSTADGPYSSAQFLPSRC